MPSEVSPCADWKLRTALSVAGPKSPSVATELPCLTSWTWSAWTAGPVLPWRTVLTRAENVAGPAMPSADRPRDCWKAVTAALVPLPKSPSAVVE